MIIEENEYNLVSYGISEGQTETVCKLRNKIQNLSCQGWKKPNLKKKKKEYILCHPFGNFVEFYHHEFRHTNYLR